MTVKVTLEFLTAADAAAFLQDFDGSAEAEGAAPASKPRGRPRRDAAAAAPAQPAAAPAPAAAAPAPAPAAAAPAAPAQAATVPFKDVADAVTELAEVSRDKAVAVLAQFGAQLASQLKPEQFGAVVAACKAAMAPAPTQSLI